MSNLFLNVKILWWNLQGSRDDIGWFRIRFNNFAWSLGLRSQGLFAIHEMRSPW